jgi:hypothetical protein
MNGLFIHTSIYGMNDLKKILKKKTLGKDNNHRGYQIPLFAEKPIIFCSYFCKGYENSYGDRPGIIFEPNSEITYACPVDTWEFLREGNWMQGHERFIFPSIEKMLEKYPTLQDFKMDFQEYFRGLDPQKLYRESATQNHERDYCLRKDWKPGCNEIAFEKPLLIKNAKIFLSREELESKLSNQI